MLSAAEKWRDNNHGVFVVIINDGPTRRPASCASTH
jgi:hypothetical protein